MKVIIALAASVVIAAPGLAAPSVAVAHPYYSRTYPCWAARRAAAHNGAVTGGILGAVLGGAIAGRGSRFGGAVIGGTVGAVAGHEAGRHSLRCRSYGHRRRFAPRRDCRWVEQDVAGQPRQFKLCR